MEINDLVNITKMCFIITFYLIIKIIVNLDRNKKEEIKTLSKHYFIQILIIISIIFTFFIGFSNKTIIGHNLFDTFLKLFFQILGIYNIINLYDYRRLKGFLMDNKFIGFIKHLILTILFISIANTEIIIYFIIILND